jgi:hypothetical protein
MQNLPFPQAPDRPCLELGYTEIGRAVRFHYAPGSSAYTGKRLEHIQLAISRGDAKQPCHTRRQGCSWLTVNRSVLTLFLSFYDPLTMRVTMQHIFGKFEREIWI